MHFFSTNGISQICMYSALFSQWVSFEYCAEDFKRKHAAIVSNKCLQVTGLPTDHQGSFLYLAVLFSGKHPHHASVTCLHCRALSNYLPYYGKSPHVVDCMLFC